MKKRIIVALLALGVAALLGGRVCASEAEVGWEEPFPIEAYQEEEAYLALEELLSSPLSEVLEEGEPIDFTEDFEGYQKAVAGFNKLFAPTEEAPEEEVPENALGEEVLEEVPENDPGEEAPVEGPMEMLSSPDRSWEVTGVLVRTEGKRILPYEQGLLFDICGPEGREILFYRSRKEAEQALSFYASQEETLYAELDGEVVAAEIGEPREEAGEALLLEESVEAPFYSEGARQLGLESLVDFAGQWGSGKALVAVLDSGVHLHPLIDAKIAGLGYDYVDADEDPTNDLYGHGTHVAGIISDCTGDLPVGLYPIRILNASGGGKISNVICGIEAAVRAGAHIINLSLVSRKESEALDLEMKAAVAAGVCVVQAAGNDHVDTAGVTGAHLMDKGIVVVGATQSGENGALQLAPYSNYGESVDVYCLGTNILAASAEGGMETSSGTSLAAPHISAVCALLLLLHPDLSPAKLEERVVAATKSQAVQVLGKKFEMALLSCPRMVPKERGFSLSQVKLRKGEALPLPRIASPDSCREEMAYASSDSGVAKVEEGSLLTLQEGTCQVSCQVLGLPEASFEVQVLEAGKGEKEGAKKGRLSLPNGIREIGEEAFLGDEALEVVFLPESLVKMGERAFDECRSLRFVSAGGAFSEVGENLFSGAVLLCEKESPLAALAREKDLPFLEGEREAFESALTPPSP